MTPTSLIIVADRGNLKAYKVDEAPGRGASLQLVQAFALTDAHGLYQDKLTDQAGRPPVSGGGDAAGGGRHTNGVAERQGLAAETDRRIHKQLAEHVEEIVRREAPVGWSFAAPASIHAAVLDLVASEVRDQIVEHVKADLVKIEPAKLSAHFRSLQPV